MVFIVQCFIEGYITYYHRCLYNQLYLIYLDYLNSFMYLKVYTKLIYVIAHQNGFNRVQLDCAFEIRNSVLIPPRTLKGNLSIPVPGAGLLTGRGGKLRGSLRDAPADSVEPTIGPIFRKICPRTNTEANKEAVTTLS